MPHATYMPQVFGQGIAAQGDALCGMNDMAWAFADAWMALIDGYARGITCHPLCTQAAQEQADWLAVNDFVKDDEHRGENGSFANERLARTGFRVPLGWDLQANYVESAKRSWLPPDEAAQSLAIHGTHREHMQFAGDFWSQFVYFGVGSAPAQLDRGGTFYVAVTAVEGD